MIKTIIVFLRLESKHGLKLLIKKIVLITGVYGQDGAYLSELEEGIKTIYNWYNEE